MEGSEGRVQHINSPQEYAQALLLGTARGRLVVVDFSATWCGPCNAIAPVYAQFSTKYPTVDFLKVDVDDQQDIATHAGVSAMPTFHFYKNGTVVDVLTGANASKLEALIKKHSASGAPSSSDSIKMPAGHEDITEHVDRKQASCLNQNSSHTWDNILSNTSSYLESDSDPQLLIYLPFSQPVKIHSLCFQAPSNGKAPSTVKLYVNNPHMDFSSVDSTEATQEITLQEQDINGDTLVPLKFVKFQNVSSLTLFVENNQGEEETTVLQRLRIIGSLLSATNMKDFKRVAGEKGEVHG
jgi:thioredoxin